MNGIVNIEPGQNTPLETIHVYVRSAEKALIRPITVLPPSVGKLCAVHPNALIYSSLKLNAAVNTPSDSITVWPYSSTDEACAPLIKFQNAIEMAKIWLPGPCLSLPREATATASTDIQSH